MDSAPSFDVIDRRMLLMAGLGALGVAAWGGCSHQQDAEPKVGDESSAKPKFTGLIDSHCHLWSGDLQRFPIAPWADKDKMEPASFTAEELWDTARPHGVDRVVIVQHSPYFGYDPAYLVDCWRRFPGAFAIVGMIDERQPDLASRLKGLAEQGVRGIRISPKLHGDRTPVADPPNWLNAPRMKDLWTEATAQHLAICPQISPDFLPTLDPMCGQFPDTVCVIDHMGHAGIKSEDDILNLTRLARHPKVYVKLSAFWTFGAKQPPYADIGPLIRRVYDAFGPKRLMWGSDCPFQLAKGQTYADSIELIRTGLDFLTADDRRSILGGTAEQLYFA